MKPKIEVPKYIHHQIVSEYQSGKSIDSLSKEFSLSVKVIKRLLNGHRTLRRRKTNINQMITLYTQGKTVKELAEMFKVDPSVIRHSLLRRGLSTRSKYYSCEDNSASIFQLIEQGKTQAEICHILNLKSNTLNEYLKRKQLNHIVVKNIRYSSSVAEKEILEWLKMYKPLHKYKYDKNKEIDIYLPQYKLGIEYCGVYWHREGLRGKKIHIDKLNDCRAQGIRLLTVFDYEWHTKKDIIKSIILSKLKKLEHIVFARKCDVRQISANEAACFLRDNHLQGSPPNIIFAVGLYLNNELIATMVFGNHHRTKNIQILNRLAFKQNMQIIGGSQKLFKYAISQFKTIGINTCYTYSDNRWSEGKIYEDLGFTLDRVYPPDYFYVNISTGTIHSKQSQKKTAPEKTLHKTEYELRLAQGYDRIWDCGKKRWLFKDKYNV